MPQVGWLDSANKDKPVPFDQALAEAEAYGSWAGMPYEVLLGIYRQVTKERPDGISVTQVLGCARKVYLEGKLDYYARPEDNYAAFRGTVVHAILDANKPADATTEVRLEREHRGVVISGQPDTLRLIGGSDGRYLLRDWKTTAKLPLYDNAYSHHQEQVNLYRWLLQLDPRRTDIEVVYLSMDGVKVIPLKRGGTNRLGRAIPNQVWTDEQVGEFLDQRLMPLAVQRKYDAPVSYWKVPAEDLWQCDYCPVRDACYQMAAEEAKSAWAKGEDVTALPPRAKEKKK